MKPRPLPLELQWKIIQHADNDSDLCSLALCCRNFRDEAQKSLFRHPTAVGFSQLRNFLEAIICSPTRLAFMVQSYWMVEPSRDNLEAERRIAATALYHMRHLTSLEVEHPDCIDIVALMHCAFKLEVLIWGSKVTTEETPPMLFDFLGAQPTLRRLTIYDHPSAVENREVLRDNPKWCPNLVYLGAQQGFLDIFLAEHRSIRHLECFRFSSASAELANIPSSRTESVEYLTILTYEPRLDFPFLERMASLVLLDVITSYTSDTDMHTKVLPSILPLVC